MLPSKYSMAVATVLLGFGAGHFMQYGKSVSWRADGGSVRVASADTAGYSSFLTDAPGAFVNPVAITGALPGIPLPPLDTLQPLPGLGMPGRSFPLPADQPTVTYSAGNFGNNPFGEPCTPSFTAIPSEGGMALLSLSAPCELSSRIVLNYSGLSLTYVTSVTGEFITQIPVFERNTKIEIYFPGGDIAETQLIHPHTAEYMRAGLSWSGGSDWAVNVHEFGVAEPASGQVFRRSPGSAVSTGEGTLIQLGDSGAPDPMLAEIYSISSVEAGDGGMVRLSIRSQVTTSNCDTETEARSVHSENGEAPRWVNLNLGMSGCDEIGSFLVLKNPLRDMMIARN